MSEKSVVDNVFIALIEGKEEVVRVDDLSAIIYMSNPCLLKEVRFSKYLKSPYADSLKCFS
ncbi:MAG: hypothetical protein IT281_10915 [Ignavibacteria bacterium]|nr:hypothetical protein [Ignavibacteria bacterium]